MTFNQKVVRIGIITMVLAIIANFCPALYVSTVYDVMPSWVDFVALESILAATFFVSWVVQPISFYPALGTAGTYMSFLAGSVGDIRVPAIQMAQKASHTESCTPKGEVMAVIGVAASVVVSFVFVTVFVFIGQAVIPMFPPFVKESFAYLLPSLFAGVYTNLALKDRESALYTIVCGIGCFAVAKTAHIPGGLIPLFCVICGGIVAQWMFKKRKALQGK
ncbi:MAG: hypothetical protein Q4D21_10285 [Phascolarctobacterium sp.]|nr:hypothetical protein [Phascolarctobacterium sp.]